MGQPFSLSGRSEEETTFTPAKAWHGSCGRQQRARPRDLPVPACCAIPEVLGASNSSDWGSSMAFAISLGKDFSILLSLWQGEAVYLVLTDKILAGFLIYFLFSKRRQHTERRFLIGINTVLRRVPRGVNDMESTVQWNYNSEKIRNYNELEKEFWSTVQFKRHTSVLYREKWRSISFS